MSKQSETELRNKLRSEILKYDEFRPSVEQDDIFQENLNDFSEQTPASGVQVSRYSLFVAAMLVLAFSFSFIVEQGEDKPNIEIIPVAKLIDASNQIEKDLSNFNTNELSSIQYIEALKIRDYIGELDSDLNALYQRKAIATDEKIHELWQQRLQMTRQLKAIYTQQYSVARI